MAIKKLRCIHYYNNKTRCKNYAQLMCICCGDALCFTHADALCRNADEFLVDADKYKLTFVAPKVIFDKVEWLSEQKGA